MGVFSVRVFFGLGSLSLAFSVWAYDSLRLLYLRAGSQCLLERPGVLELRLAVGCGWPCSSSCVLGGEGVTSALQRVVHIPWSLEVAALLMAHRCGTSRTSEQWLLVPVTQPRVMCSVLTAIRDGLNWLPPRLCSTCLRSNFDSVFEFCCAQFGMFLMHLDETFDVVGCTCSGAPTGGGETGSPPPKPLDYLFNSGEFIGGGGIALQALLLTMWVFP